MSAITPKSPSKSDNFLLPKGSHSVKYLGIAILGIAWIGATGLLVTLSLSFIFSVAFQTTSSIDFWSVGLHIAVIGMALSTIIITMIVSFKQARRKIGRGFGAWIEKVADLSIMQHFLLFALFEVFI